MLSFLIYLLKSSISLAVVCLFYQLLLRRLTFYAMNRWYLLGYSVLSFFIPLINIYPILREEGSAGEPYLIRFIPVVGGQGRGAIADAHIVAGGGHASIGWGTWLIWAFALGAVILLVRTVIRGWSLYRLRKSARLIESGPLRIYQVDASIIPFSFGNSIYINQDLHTKQQWSDIILHEYVHIRQRHTVDILVAELMCILNWYNPFCWLIRWSIRQNLEFIADQQVLAKGVDKKGYQYHLLTVLGEPRYRLANNFNFSSLKKRIIMMNKMRSARLQLVKFLFIVPLAGVLLVAFRDKFTGLPVKKHDIKVASRGQEKATSKMPTREVAPGGGGGVKVGGRKERPPAVRDTTAPYKVLYVLNGDKMPLGWVPDEIAEDSILSIEVVKGEQAMRLFGEKGTNGVIAITTKKYQPASARDSIHLFDPGNHATPLYILDGKEVPVDSVNKLSPQAIENIIIYKNDEHTQAYGEKGKNGVVVITLKKDVVIVGAPGQQVTAVFKVNGEPWTITADTLRVSRP